MTGPWVVVEHRLHPRAAITYTLIDQSAMPGERHTATVLSAPEAEAIAAVLNEHDRDYRAALNEADQHRGAF